MSDGALPNEARVAVRTGPLVAAVLSRVVGMLAARALCPIDRLDDALLVTDAIAAHAPNHTLNGRVIVTVSADADAICLLVSPLRAQGAKGLLADAELPGVGNVLERVADEVTIGEAADGSGEELRIRIAFQTS
jgi:serine/threonine-protein kinase RsbW